MMFLLALLGCETQPYPDYFADPAAAPVVDAITPSSTGSLVGGARVSITGARLGSVRTVVIGGRNAELISASEGEVLAVLPDGAPGTHVADVAVVSDDGATVAEGLFTYEAAGAQIWADEVASVTIARIDCPVGIVAGMGSGHLYDGAAAAIWCGLDLGYGDASGFIGAGPQPGMAGELAGVAELSTLPPPGEVRVIGPGERAHPSLPVLYGSHPVGETLSITTPRDFALDLARIEQMKDEADLYFEGERWQGPLLELWSESGEYLGVIEVESGSGDSLVLAEAMPEAVAAGALGYGVEGYYGYASSAWLEGSGTTVTADPAGANLVYDDWSGWFFAETASGYVYSADFPANAPFDVVHERLGEITDLGSVQGMDALELLSPELMSGDLLDTLRLDRGGFTVEWTPSDDPDSYVVIDLRIYDANQDDPLWLTEVARVVGHGIDSQGSLSFSAEDLARVPEAPSAMDRAYGLFGYWAEMTVARHTLRSVPFAEGVLVVDFVHAVNGPVALR